MGLVGMSKQRKHPTFEPSRPLARRSGTAAGTREMQVIDMDFLKQPKIQSARCLYSYMRIRSHASTTDEVVVVFEAYTQSQMHRRREG